jgi:hypothetical protein
MMQTKEIQAERQEQQTPRQGGRGRLAVAPEHPILPCPMWKRQITPVVNRACKGSAFVATGALWKDNRIKRQCN